MGNCYAVGFPPLQLNPSPWRKCRTTEKLRNPKHRLPDHLKHLHLGTSSVWLTLTFFGQVLMPSGCMSSQLFMVALQDFRSGQRTAGRRQGQEAAETASVPR